ncbi:MAG TPA: tRNA uridine-5-carboxymethylaminomethyl(34) synthesis GTPase MnmE, partial [Syntrophaceae bacterium]|nr:tRNA uridine-5-carboxymethylaminomethyl(34) synthesis GTPase MnmE [Syntrophaceae bacterium]
MTETDTIAAIATPFGTAGVGIIRVSGPMAPELGRLLFRPSHANCNWQSHHAYHGDIVTADGKTILDEVLVTLMRKPRSFTGEDVLEISCHGNNLILQSILEQLMASGCRPARPGEFSERAYLNGRMDLSQA